MVCARTARQAQPRGAHCAGEGCSPVLRGELCELRNSVRSYGDGDQSTAGEGSPIPNQPHGRFPGTENLPTGGPDPAHKFEEPRESDQHRVYRFEGHGLKGLDTI